MQKDFIAKERKPKSEYDTFGILAAIIVYKASFNLEAFHIMVNEVTFIYVGLMRPLMFWLCGP